MVGLHTMVQEKATAGTTLPSMATLAPPYLKGKGGSLSSRTQQMSTTQMSICSLRRILVQPWLVVTILKVQRACQLTLLWWPGEVMMVRTGLVLW